MSDIKITKTEKSGDYSKETVFEANGIDYLQEDLIKRLFETEGTPLPHKEVKLSDVPVVQHGIKSNVVAIYDNAGIPSFMRRFSRVTNKELFGGSDKPHPAFVIGGEVYDEIYISVYENCEINGKPYSLPYQKAWVNIKNDDAAQACFSKGEGWHMMTRAEWGLLANLSKKNGTFPHGNTDHGKYYINPKEKGELVNDCITLTGSGPAIWTHDHTSEGVHDLCGNVWEMVRGLRIKDRKLQVKKNNDAAMDIDITLKGDNWQDIVDDSGKPVRVSYEDSLVFTTREDTVKDYGSSKWKDVEMECKSEMLKELALCTGEQGTYCYINCMDGEYFPICGGGWNSLSSAGIFSVRIGDVRSSSSTGVGFRSAYFKKKG